MTDPVDVPYETRPDFPGYFALVARIRACTTRAALEATIPDLCSFAEGAYRDELSRTWLATWQHLFPHTDFDRSLWPADG